MKDEIPAIDPAIVAAIEARGWRFSRQHERYVFFDKPGYWLRLWYLTGGWSASVKPEPYNCDHQRWPDDQMPPEFRGRGAKARARSHAQWLVAEHQEYLAELGLPLTHVGAIFWVGSGAGGFMECVEMNVRYLGDPA